MLKKKTPKGTISAVTYPYADMELLDGCTGIAIGLYGKESVAWLEYDEGLGKLAIRVNREAAKRFDILVDDNSSNT